jgi:hypothetical protein
MNTLDQGKKMKRVITAVALASMMSVSMAACATDVMENGSGTVSSRPSVWAMGIDAGLVRPVGVAATVIGAGIFVVTLPFSLLGGNMKESAETLVVAPAKMTFLRCLGCTEGQDNENKARIKARQLDAQ